MINEPNDSLDDLIAGLGKATERKPLVTPPASYRPVEQQLFVERCWKCSGRGTYGNFGTCFACNGKGQKTFKTSRADREHKRDQAADRKVRNAQHDLDAFATQYPTEYAWLLDTAPRWDVAASILEGVRKYGQLTEKQEALVRRGIERDAARAVERSARAAAAPTIDVAGVDRLKAAFDSAVAYTAAKGLKLSPRITIDGMTISPAKANSANPGALYVKAGTEYLGKIAQGRFYAVAACTPELQTKVLAFVANPADAAKVYGQTTGTCCVCDATLRSEWKLRGIGPICAAKFGW